VPSGIVYDRYSGGFLTGPSKSGSLVRCIHESNRLRISAKLPSGSSQIRLHPMIGAALAQDAFENLQETALILEFQIDFEPGEIQGSNGLF